MDRVLDSLRANADSADGLWLTPWQNGVQVACIPSSQRRLPAGAVRPCLALRDFLTASERRGRRAAASVTLCSEDRGGRRTGSLDRGGYILSREARNSAIVRSIFSMECTSAM